MKDEFGLYSTLKEARKAVKRLKIKTLTEYKKKCRKDKALPYHPDQTYRKKGWVDWYYLLGKKRPNFYKSYKQAQQAVKRMKINCRAEYRRRYDIDFRLPSHPDEYYCGKGWKGWGAFFVSKKK